MPYDMLVGPLGRCVGATIMTLLFVSCGYVLSFVHCIKDTSTLPPLLCGWGSRVRSSYPGSRTSLYSKWPTKPTPRVAD